MNYCYSKMIKPYLIITCFFIVVSSCPNENNNVQDHITKFYSEEGKFNQLITLLKNDTSINRNSGQTYPAILFGNSIKSKLEELGVTNVFPFIWGNHDKAFDFTTEWQCPLPIHICYNFKDSIKTSKEYYEKDENSNEIFGLGNSWALWTEKKLINAKQ
ncbi:hypothetical protein BH10BAC2_BH10BAC2_25960 [soil metagenome]